MILKQFSMSHRKVKMTLMTLKQFTMPHEKGKMTLMILKQFQMSHRKGKMTLIMKQLPMLPQDGKVNMKLTQKYIMNRNLKLQLRLKKQTGEREKKFMESELEQNKIDIQVSRGSNIKKVQNVFDEVKEEESLNVENFFDN